MPERAPVMRPPRKRKPIPKPPKLRLVGDEEPGPERPKALRVRGASKAIGRVTSAWKQKFAGHRGGQAMLNRLQSGLRAFIRAEAEKPGFDLRASLKRYEAGPMQRALSYETEKEQIQKRLWRQARRYEIGSIGKVELRRKLRNILEDGYESAARIGKARAMGRSTRGLALDRDDWREIRSVLKSEYRYLDGFLDHLQQLKRDKKRFTSAVLYRFGLYVSKFNSAENEQFLRYLPASAGERLFWRLSPAEHCSLPSSTGGDVAPGGCLGLARGGPYTKETLPTIPGNGDTACLGQCRCYLEVG